MTASDPTGTRAGEQRDSSPNPASVPGPAAVTGPSPAGLLLIADEEADQAEDSGLLPALRDRGIQVHVVADGALALVEAGRLAPSAMLVSARLPVVDGVTVVRTIRAVPGHGDLPILLAVGPDDRAQAAAGLDAGASACVGKPYRVNEVLAMIGAIGGRPAGGDRPLATAAPGRGGEGGAQEQTVLRYGPVLLDAAAHEVRVDGRIVHLPPREFRLLHLLLTQAGRVVSRETLLTEVWGSPDTDPNTLAVHVRRLRRRLGDVLGDVSAAPASEEARTALDSRSERPGEAAEAGLDDPEGEGGPGGPKGADGPRREGGERVPLIESIRGVGYRFRIPEAN